MLHLGCFHLLRLNISRWIVQVEHRRGAGSSKDPEGIQRREPSAALIIWIRLLNCSSDLSRWAVRLWVSQEAEAECRKNPERILMGSWKSHCCGWTCWNMISFPVIPNPWLNSAARFEEQPKKRRWKERWCGFHPVGGFRRNALLFFFFESLFWMFFLLRMIIRFIQ